VKGLLGFHGDGGGFKTGHIILFPKMDNFVFCWKYNVNRKKFQLKRAAIARFF